MNKYNEKKKKKKKKKKMNEWTNLKNEYKSTYDMLCYVMRLTQLQKAE